MIKPDKALLTAAGLRDFFTSRDASGLVGAYQSLIKAVQTPAPTPADWDTVEFSYNLLFVGPKSVLAPPFASVYIEKEPVVVGETTLMVRRFYQMVGLVSPWEGNVPDDHISLELDACLQLRTGLLQSGSSQLRDLYSYFLDEHMAHWIPAFVARVVEVPEVPTVISWVCMQLEEWLARERKWVCQQPSNARELLAKRKE